MKKKHLIVVGLIYCINLTSAKGIPKNSRVEISGTAKEILDMEIALTQEEANEIRVAEEALLAKKREIKTEQSLNSRLKTTLTQEKASDVKEPLSINPALETTLTPILTLNGKDPIVEFEIFTATENEKANNRNKSTIENDKAENRNESAIENEKADNRNESAAKNEKIENRNESATENEKAENRNESTIENDKAKNRNESATENEKVDNRNESATENEKVDNRNESATENEQLDNRNESATENEQLDNRNESATENEKVDNRNESATENEKVDNRNESTIEKEKFKPIILNGKEIVPTEFANTLDKRQYELEQERQEFERRQQKILEDLEIKKQAYDINKKNIEKTQEGIDINVQEQNIINSEIDYLDLKIIALEEEIQSIEYKIKLKEIDIENAKLKLYEAEKERLLHYEKVKDRMVRIYKNNRYNYMDLIFSSSSLLELLNRSYYIKIISKMDRTVLNELREKQNIVTKNKKQLDIELKKFEILRDDQLEKVRNLSSYMNDKMIKIEQLEISQSSLEEQLGALEIVSTELTQEIKSLIAQSEMKFDGAIFLWPVPGWTYVSSDYNPRENPILKIPEFHQGIDIPATYGTPVVAAANGIVIIAGWVNGFGYTVMIDHGDGLTSLYGHNSTLDVRVGDKVEAGDQIAGIGSTGYSTGNHLHFEVREHGRHKNPWPYLGGKE
ncbi:MAG: hypothetical protein ATN31_08960 [Candidatus Epulonipiscioides saccharophilum]|nr:MAG: hypothetical protein ATN31_08960 [Epulopiscium sp. AS2M-Bin001]